MFKCIVKFIKDTLFPPKKTKAYLWQMQLPSGAIANTSMYFTLDEPPVWEGCKTLRHLPLTEIEE